MILHMTTEQLIDEALRQTLTAIGYHVAQRLKTLYP